MTIISMMKLGLGFFMLMLTLAWAQIANAQDFVGTHRGEQASVESGERYTLKRTLVIDRSGVAELISEYQGERPSITRKSTDAFGWLLSDIARDRVIRHRGSWRVEQGRLRVVLQTLSLTNSAGSVRSEFLFRLDRNILLATEQDPDNYGSQKLRLNFGGKGTTTSGNNRLVGSYEVRQESTERDNPFTLFRTLRLESNGEARIEWSYRGDEPSVSRSNLRRFGDILADMVPVGKIVHTGTWKMDGAQLRVDLSRLGATDRVSATLQFEVKDRTLTLKEWDRDAYGSQRFTMTPGSSGGGSGTAPGIWNPVEGTYAMNFTLKSTAEITRTLKLMSGGKAELETEYPATRRTQVLPEDQRLFGEPILKLGTQKSFKMEGTWTRSGNQITVTFTRIDGESIRATMKLESRDGSIVAASHDTKAFGTTLIKFRRQ